MMTLQGVTYTGPPLESPARLEGFPGPLVELLWQVNGFVAYAGGLHFRGLVDEPDWHSLEDYHTGEMALYKLFRNIRREDLPFAQDYLGNQFFLREGGVWRLRADTGETSDLGVDLAQFFGNVRDDPVSYLSLDLLARYYERNEMLKPGQLLHTMPPLCMKPPQRKLHVRPVAVGEAVAFLANFARQIADVPDGAEVNLRLFTPKPDGPVN